MSIDPTNKGDTEDQSGSSTGLGEKGPEMKVEQEEISGTEVCR